MNRHATSIGCMSLVIAVMLTFTVGLARSGGPPWGHPKLTLTREEVRVDWVDRRGRRVDAPHGARGTLTIVNAEAGETEIPLRAVLFSKWQPEPPHLVARVRLLRVGPYPVRLRMSLVWTFQRGGPVLIEYDLDRRDGVPRPVDPTPDGSPMADRKTAVL